jgi:hypothetical protein
MIVIAVILTLIASCWSLVGYLAVMMSNNHDREMDWTSVFLLWVLALTSWLAWVLN